MESYHYARTDYYSGPCTKGEQQCGLCECQQFKKGEQQDVFILRQANA
jgi:hypothetical protein